MEHLYKIRELIKIGDLIFYQIVFSIFLLLQNDDNIKHALMICFISAPLFSAFAPPAAVYLSLNRNKSIRHNGRRNLLLFFVSLLLSWLLISFVLTFEVDVSFRDSIFSLFILINAALAGIFRRSYKGIQASIIELYHKAVIASLIGMMIFMQDAPIFRYVALAVMASSAGIKIFKVRRHFFINNVFSEVTHIAMHIQINVMQTLSNQLDSIYLTLISEANAPEYFIFNRIIQSGSNIIGSTRLFTGLFIDVSRKYVFCIMVGIGIFPIIGFMIWRVSDIFLALSYSFSAMKNTQYGLAINNSGIVVKNVLFIAFVAGVAIFFTGGFTLSRLGFFGILTAGVIWASSRAGSR